MGPKIKTLAMPRGVARTLEQMFGGVPEPEKPQSKMDEIVEAIETGERMQRITERKLDIFREMKTLYTENEGVRRYVEMTKQLADDNLGEAPELHAGCGDPDCEACNTENEPVA